MFLLLYLKIEMFKNFLQNITLFEIRNYAIKKIKKENLIIG